MASSNDHMSIPHPPSKSRLSPLDFRNTELVSRLLAATPPYLYNMSLLPNTYFFSEMLRSLVQAKQENAANTETLMTTSMHPRRSRKRPWLLSRQEEFSKPLPKIEKTAETTEWPRPPPTDKASPVELVRKSPSTRQNEDMKGFIKEKQPPFQGMTPETTNPNLVLPPAPPIWFPPIYPNPYVDPLHFFIDLRVSGHIYDKTQKDSNNPDRPTVKDYPSTVVSNCETERNVELERNSLISSRYGSHNSAFSVPIQRLNKNSPMNLSQIDKEVKCTKFDVKSLGFEKNTNKIGTNYILPHIETIYKGMYGAREEIGGSSQIKKSKYEDDKSGIGFKLFFDSDDADVISNRSLSRGQSPVDVVDNDEQGYKIDIQS